MSATPFQQIHDDNGDVEMMDVDHLSIQEPGHLPKIRTLPEKTVWKGSMPITDPIASLSQWNTISVPPSETVAPYDERPNWAANGVEVGVRADRVAGDPLLTEYSMETWIETMFVFMSRMMGETKWKYYKNLVRYILFNNFEPRPEDEDVDPRAEGSLYDFLEQNSRVAYLHNDVARQLRHVPIIPDLEPVDEETLSLIERIADDWGREVKIVKGQPRTTNGQREGREDEEGSRNEACMVALEFFDKWKGHLPARGRSVPTLLSAFGTMKM
jgi:hypothetical protein